MTIEIASLRTYELRRIADLRKAAATLAGGQSQVKSATSELEAQRRATAQATFDTTKKFVLETVRNARTLMALGGDLTGMVNMVDNALRQAQPAIRTLRNGLADAKTAVAFTKQVRDLTNVAEQVGLMARIAANGPDTERRAERSWAALSRTLRDVRGQSSTAIFV